MEKLNGIMDKITEKAKESISIDENWHTCSPEMPPCAVCKKIICEFPPLRIFRDILNTNEVQEINFHISCIFSNQTLNKEEEEEETLEEFDKVNSACAVCNNMLKCSLILEEDKDYFLEKLYTLNGFIRSGFSPKFMKLEEIKNNDSGEHECLIFNKDGQCFINLERRKLKTGDFEYAFKGITLFNEDLIPEEFKNYEFDELYNIPVKNINFIGKNKNEIALEVFHSFINQFRK